MSAMHHDTTGLAHALHRGAADPQRLDVRNIGVFGYMQGVTFWCYRAPTTPLAVAMQPGFFAEAGGMLAPGDLVMVTAQDGAGMLWVARDDLAFFTVPFGQVAPQARDLAMQPGASPQAAGLAPGANLTAAQRASMDTLAPLLASLGTAS